MTNMLKLILCLLLAQQANADRKEYSIDLKKRIIIPIAEHGINRVFMDKDRILKIVGNEAEYILESDLARGQLFITSKLAHGDNFNVTLFSEKGVIQDITFKVENLEEPASILLKPQSLVNIKPKTSSSTSRQRDLARISSAKIREEATNSIKDILTGNLKGYRARIIFGASLANKTPKLSVAQPFELLPVKIVKVTEYRKRRLKILNIECAQDTKIQTQNLALYFPKLVAATYKGNNLIIVERI